MSCSVQNSDLYYRYPLVSLGSPVVSFIIHSYTLGC
uniref:Uncharacterized protein n=1 Tax=virus sp. ctqq75 TaxID=2827999 RepID=A0A8S5RET6_9VIRU|nr:MAG TPA: hypothetical protein [virus sp. ctqq75]